MKKKCLGCGICCRLFLINLNKKEYESGKFQTLFKNFKISDNFFKAKNYGANILAQKEDGSCIYLKDKSCSIHSERPSVCREFYCSSKNKRFAGMIKQIAARQ